MPTDFIPQSYKNLRDWLQKQSTIATVAPAIGMSATEQTAFVENINQLLPLLTSIVEHMEQMEQKVADLQPLLDDVLPLVRKDIKRAKTAPGYLPSIGEEYGWIGESSEIDLATRRPSIDATVQRGRVKIDGKKLGFEAVNIYSRKKSEVTWKLIAVRKRKFPLYDETPLSGAGVPEVREYMAVGVENDEEIGNPSEIQEVIYAG